MTANACWNIAHFRSGLVRALLGAGFRVTVAAPEGEGAAALAALGCRVLPLPVDGRGLSPARDALLLLRLCRILLRERPDAVLSYTIKNNIHAALAGRLACVPVLPNVTGLGTAFMRAGPLNRLARALYRIAFARVPAVFFQNPDDRGLFVAAGLVRAGQARLLPGSGIDLGRFRPAPPPANPAPVFLYVGRILRDKGVVELVEAARAVRRRHPRALFRLLGACDAPNRSAIDRATVEGWVREGIVEHPGARADVRADIAAADCVVLPSYREGAPRSLLEAAAMARPAVATDVPGCRSVVEHGRTGLLCRPRDAGDLAAALCLMIEIGPAARAAMGARARQRVERDYDEALVAAAYLRELRRLPGAPRGSGGLASAAADALHGGRAAGGPELG